MPDIVGTLKPPKLATAPTSPALGQMYFDTSTNKLMNWNGTSWVSASQGSTGPQGPPGPQGPEGPTRFGLEAIGPQVNDLNTIGSNGWYCTIPGVTNAPVNDYGAVMFTNVTYTAAGRMFFFQHGTSNVWMRTLNGGTWTGWTKTWPLDDANLPGRIAAIYQGPVSNDLNVQDSGWTNSDSSTANRPSDNYCVVFTVRHSGGGIASQRAVEVNGGRMGTIWQRVQWGSWTSWEKIYPLSDNGLPPRLQSVSPASGDLNSMQTNGWAYANSSSNMPPSGDTQWFVEFISWGSVGYGTQIAHALSSNDMYKRRLIAGNWQPWVKVYPLPANQTTIDDSNLPARLKSNDWLNNITDANNALQSGWYGVSGGASNNMPTSSDWHLQVYGYDGSWCIQIAYQFYLQEAWIRNKNSGTWQPWHQMYSSASGPAMPGRLERDTTTYGVSVSDWNNARENGFYQGPPGSTNAPDGSWYLGIVVAHRSVSPAYITQEVWEFTSSLQTPRWRRVCSNDAWQPWYRVWENDCGLAQNIPPGGAWVYFAKPFRYAPTVVATCTTWEGNGVTQAQIQNVDTGKFFLVHASGSTLNFQWIACGQ